VGRPVLAGVILAVVCLSACGRDSRTDTTSQVQQPTATASQSPASTGSQVVAKAVQASCGNRVPSLITTTIPGASATYTPHYAVGSTCQWHTNDISRRVLAVAVTTVPYSGWQRMQPTLTEHTTVAGHPAVRGHILTSCVVLVDVEGSTLDVELTGVSDPSCDTTTDLAGQILSAGGN
jgi:hypothetical protein